MIQDKNKGVHDLDTHHLLEIREPPPSIVALRTELQLHPDILAYAMECRTFEESMAAIAIKLDIVVDGLYDAATLADVLVTSLRKRSSNKNSPHLRDSRLVNAEIVERGKEVSLEIVEGDLGTIAPAPLEITAAGYEELGNTCYDCKTRAACNKEKVCALYKHRLDSENASKPKFCDLCRDNEYCEEANHCSCYDVGLTPVTPPEQQS